MYKKIYPEHLSEIKALSALKKRDPATFELKLQEMEKQKVTKKIKILSTRPKNFPMAMVIGFCSFILGLICCFISKDILLVPAILIMAGGLTGLACGMMYFGDWKNNYLYLTTPEMYERKRQVELAERQREIEEAEWKYEIQQNKERARQREEAERQLNEYRMLQAEKEAAEQSQRSGAPWDKQYYTYPCPYCGHYKVRPATWDDKRMSVAFNGVHSQKIGKRFKCEHCKMMWS